MGMYDTVLVPCPVCFRETGFQSKSGECLMDDFKLEAAPEDVLVDVNRHAPQRCFCRIWFKVDRKTNRSVVASQEDVDRKRERIEAMRQQLLKQAEQIAKEQDELGGETP